MKSIRPWTSTEDRTIRRLGSTRTAKQLAQMLRRTPCAVHQRAYRLRVRLQKDGDRDFRTKYSDCLVESIRALHEAGLGPRVIASRVHVPEGSVRSFCYYRGRLNASLSLLPNTQP